MESSSVAGSLKGVAEFVAIPGGPNWNRDVGTEPYNLTSRNSGVYISGGPKLCSCWVLNKNLEYEFTWSHTKF